jgi:hypothetical protein
LIDSFTKLPKIGTVLVIKESGGYFTSDANGEVKAQVPSQGYYTFRIISGTDVEIRRKEVIYDGQKIQLFVGKERNASIEVRGEKEKNKLSRFTLQQEEIKRLPGVQGDSLKAILTLPGVVPAIPIGLTPTAALIPSQLDGPYKNSDRGDLVLRGAGSRANQFYFDGFPVTYPFHLGNQSSVFNNNIIKSFEVLTGAYTTRYGFATGGIIQVEPKSDIKSTSTYWNTNLFLTDVMFESPISKNSYIIASARKNYPNLVLLRLYPEGIPENAKYADYQDYQLKLGYDFSDSHKISYTGFGARDRQAYTKSQAEFENSGSGRADSRPPVGLDKSFRTDGFRYIFKAGSRFQNTLNVSRNSFKEFFEVKFDNPATAETIFGLQNVTTQNIYYVENIQNLEIVKNFLKLEVGQNYRERSITLKGENISQQNTQFSNFFNSLIDSSPTFRALIDGDKAFSKEFGAFIESTFSYYGFRWIAGTRWDHYKNSDQKALSPRTNASYTFDKTRTTFSGGVGIHRNAPVGIEQISERVGNPRLRMERAEHQSVGVEQEVSDTWTIKIEGYRNIFTDLVVPDSIAREPFSLNNQPRDLIQRFDSVVRNPLVEKGLNYSNYGDGYSKGVELYIKKSEGNSKFFGWLSYSNSVTKRNNHQARLKSAESTDRSLLNRTRRLLYQTDINKSYLNYYDNNQLEIVYDNDKEELYDLDRTHVLNFVFGWKPNRDWQIGSRFRYLTNTPINPIVGSDQLTQAATFGAFLNIPKYSEYYNSDRLAAFHQVDLRIDRFHHYDWGYINTYLELINVYARRNVSGQTFDVTKPYNARSNPSQIIDNLNSPYIQSKNGSRVYYLPLINIGMEIKF